MKIRSLLAATAALTLSWGLMAAPPASAEPTGGANVGISPLSATPTAMPQTNNTVFALGYANGVLYLGGTFTEVRPAGAAPHTQVTNQARLAAVDVASGRIISTWAPRVTGGDIYSMAVSPDQTRLYVGGTFNKVNDRFAGKIAGFDITNPSAPRQLSNAEFNGANVNGKVTALEATNDAAYVGGYFTQARGVARGRLAAFSANGGALLPWQPSVTGTSSTQFYPQPFVTALESDGAGRMAVGGMFDQVNGRSQHGLGLVDTATGASVPGFTPPAIQPLSYVTTIEFTEGRLIYAGRDDKTGSRARLEGVTAVDANTGAVAWGADNHRCMGDTFALIAVAGKVWAGTHAHDCRDVGGYPEANPRFYGSVLGQDPATGEQAHFYPSLTGAGNEPGSLNNVRAFATDGQQLFVAGGFLKVNGFSQQNLNSYVLKGDGGGLAPVKVGKPTAVPAAGGARVSWTASSDIDDRTLTYRIYRNNGSVPVGEVTANSTFWSRPTLSFTDSTAPAGVNLTYKVEVRDASNVQQRSLPSAAVTAGAVPSTYEEAVLADDPAFYWRFDETSGGTVADSSTRNNTGTLSGGQLGVGGIRGGGAHLTGDQHVTEAVQRTNPMPYSTELWFRSTSQQGGKLMGFGNSTTGISSSYDRHVYMTNSGNLVFGAYTGAAETVSSPGTYNDGAWHHVVATQDSGGMNLYVDGARVAQNTVGQAQSYAGYFRVGGDSLSGWPSQPTSRGLDADVDEAAVYLRALSEGDVAAHYALR